MNRNISAVLGIALSLALGCDEGRERAAVPRTPEELAEPTEESDAEFGITVDTQVVEPERDQGDAPPE